MRRMREEVGDRRGQGPRRVCGVVKAWPVRQCAWLVRAVQLFAMVSCLDTSRVAPGLTAAFVGQRSPARTAAGLSGPRCPQMPGASLAYPCKSGRGCPRPLGNQHRSRTALRSTKSGRVFVDHYEVLGVAAAAEPAEIKLAFRALSRKYHPDVNPDSEQEIYRRITASYNILSDPERRALYDRKRVQARSSSGGGQLLQNFEDALQKRWTTHGAGHSCNAFCDCDPGTAPDAGTTEPLAYRDWLTAGEPEETFRGGQAKKGMRRADSSSWQDVEGACDEIDDAGRVLTPPSAFEELSSFLAQAKRASYSRPRIYTCRFFCTKLYMCLFARSVTFSRPMHLVPAAVGVAAPPQSATNAIFAVHRNQGHHTRSGIRTASFPFTACINSARIWMTIGAMSWCTSITSRAHRPRTPGAPGWMTLVY